MRGITGDANAYAPRLANTHAPLYCLCLQVDTSDIVRSLFMRGITLSMSQALDRNTVKVRRRLASC